MAFVVLVAYVTLSLLVGGLASGVKGGRSFFEWSTLSLIATPVLALAALGGNLAVCSIRRTGSRRLLTSASSKLEDPIEIGRSARSAANKRQCQVLALRVVRCDAPE